MCSTPYLRSTIVLVPTPSLSVLLISDKDGQFQRCGSNRAGSPYVCFSCKADDSTREARVLRPSFSTVAVTKLSRLGRPLHVSMRTPTLTAYPIIINRLSASRWEFVTTLDYEWSVIRRRRPYRWTIGVRDDSHLPDPEMRLICPSSIRQIYSITRLATLMAVILSMLGIDITTPLNCQVCRDCYPSYVHPHPDRL